MSGKLKSFLESTGGALRMGTYILLRPVLRPRYTRWGATEAEVNRTLPGDEVVPTPKGGYTHAVTIEAPPDVVWAWLVQVGQGRAGFYSYDFLENIIGCQIHSADTLIPEYRHDETSPGLQLHPKMPPMPLITQESGKVLVFGGNMDPDTPVAWMFYLESPDGKTTRLISRWRYDFKPSFGTSVGYNLFLEPIASVMQRKMLLGIKKRVEG